MAQQRGLGNLGTTWNAVEIGPKRDVLGDLSEAIRRKGLRMGYFCAIPILLEAIGQHAAPQNDRPIERL